MNTRRYLIFISLICIFSLTLSLFSCNVRIDGGGTTQGGLDIEDITGGVDTDISSKDEDSSFTESNATTITFSDSSATVSGLGANADGTSVTITGGGTFILTGSTSNGSITVNSLSDIKVQLVLSSLSLTNQSGPAINVRNAKKVTITLAEGTVNTISDGSSYNLTESGTIVDGAIFSKSNLVFNGEGKLIVNGNNAHAIASKDNLTVAGGTYEINAKKTALYGKDFVKLASCDMTISAGTDAIKSDNAVDSAKGFIYVKDGKYILNAVNDAIQAYNLVSIEGGDFEIKTTSTSSTLSSKGIKGNAVAISGGSFNIDSKDDAIHSNGDIVISGGDITANTDDDGIHADSTVTVSGGKIIISRSYEGIEGSDITINGGYIEINSSDDGVNVSGGNDSSTTTDGLGRPGGDMFEATSGVFAVSGGYLIVHNEGDGIDSNGSIEISGGVVLVDGPSRGGNGSFDYNGTAKITGGVVVMLGISDMAQNFSEAEQGSILVRSSGSFSAGTILSLCDENGKVIIAFRSTKVFTAALFSAPELKVGGTYTFYANASVDGIDENGFAHNTTQSGGTSCGSVTLSSLISGQGSGMPGGGGRPPRY